MDIIDIRYRPELREFADHIRKTKRVTILRDADEEIATVTPAQPAKRRRSPRRPTYLTPDDSLWNIVGMHEAKEGPTDVSENKHKYLAEAYTPKDK